MNQIGELGSFSGQELLGLRSDGTALFSVKQAEGSKFSLVTLSRAGAPRKIFEKTIESPWIYLGFFTKRNFSLITAGSVKTEEGRKKDDRLISETLFLSTWEENSAEPDSFINVKEIQASPEFRSITHMKTEKVSENWIKTTLSNQGEELVSFFDLERHTYSPFQALSDYGVPKLSFWNLLRKPFNQEPIPLSYSLLSSKDKTLYVEKGVEIRPSQIFGLGKVVDVSASIIEVSENQRKTLFKIDLPSSAISVNTFYSYNYPFCIAAHLEQKKLCNEGLSLIVSAADIQRSISRNIILSLEKDLSKQFYQSIEGTFIEAKGLCFLAEHILVLYNGQNVVIYDLRNFEVIRSLDRDFLDSGKIEKVFLQRDYLYLSVLSPNGSSKVVGVSVENNPV